MVLNKYIILLCLAFSYTGVAQTQPYAGEYTASHGANDAKVLIEYTLSLRPNGSFLFHSYRKNNNGLSPDENLYAKGKWAIEKKNQLFFYINKETDLDATHTLNFSKTKARYITKSPRDVSGQVIKTSLLFYNSEISWVKGMKLLKTE